MARYDRDILGQRGAKWVIVSEGVNDIGGARGADSSASIARQLIDAYQQMITRAHARGMRAYGATILPFAGSQYGSPEHEAARQTVNSWIRSSHAFDGVIDLDAVMRDPAEPTRMRADVDSGDHLHPNERGYVVMAEAIDLSLFVP
jgi:lysophospholipase L1-like esterase